MSIPVEVFRFLTIDCELGPAPELLSASESLVSANKRFLVDEPQPPAVLKSISKKYISKYQYDMVEFNSKQEGVKQSNIRAPDYCIS